MRRLSDKGILRTVGQRVTPVLGRAVNGLGVTGGVELMAAYLSLLVGKGCGTGWDGGEAAATASLLRERGVVNPIIIDCGANRGRWTCEIRRCLGSDGGRWITIEPDPECQTFLGRLPNVEIIEAAVGEVPAVMKLYSDEGASGLASLHPRGDSFAQDYQFAAREVSVVTLDSVIETKGLEGVDFLKMDIEGHELSALKGAMKALQAGKVKALSFEFGAANINSRTYFRDFWNLLRPLGFELQRICPGGSTVRVQDYYEDLEAFRGASNYIAAL